MPAALGADHVAGPGLEVIASVQEELAGLRAAGADGGFRPLLVEEPEVVVVVLVHSKAVSIFFLRPRLRLGALPLTMPLIVACETLNSFASSAWLHLPDE